MDKDMEGFLSAIILTALTRHFIMARPASTQQVHDHLPKGRIVQSNIPYNNDTLHS